MRTLWTWATHGGIEVSASHQRSDQDQPPPRQVAALLNHLWATRLEPEGCPYTLTEVSKATGMSVPYLSILRKDTIGAVPFHRVAALARFFHVPLDYFSQEGPPTDTLDDLVRELRLRAGKIGTAQRALLLQMLDHADQVLHELAPSPAAPPEQVPPPTDGASGTAGVSCMARWRRTRHTISPGHGASRWPWAAPWS